MLKGILLHREWSDLAEIRTHPRFYACPGFLQVWKRADQKQHWKGGETVFPLQVNVHFLLPWKLEFWSNLPQNLMQPFPLTNYASYKIWPRLANCLRDI